MVDPREREIRKNYDFFKSVVSSIMAEHAGKTALIRDAAIVDFYDTPAEAVAQGTELFGSLPFSVQRVINRPIDLGFLSHATDNGIAV
jgi:hypothetical protein